MFVKINERYYQTIQHTLNPEALQNDTGLVG